MKDNEVRVRLWLVAETVFGSGVLIGYGDVDVDECGGGNMFGL